MQRASLALNNLDGIIPDELGRLSALDLLNLYSNNLSGMVPEQLYNISSLNTLSLAENQLTGPLPRYIGSTLPNLQNLYLGRNQFFGHIPESFVNCSGLVDIDLAYNALTGPIPNNLGNLQNLERINFGSNPLGDENGSDLTFLTSLTNCSNLRLVCFYKNRLTGVLPISIANLSTNLYWLQLHTNYLTGNIPVEIENLKNLEYLALAGNMLTGRLPDSIGKLSKLQQLYKACPPDSEVSTIITLHDFLGFSHSHKIPQQWPFCYGESKLVVQDPSLDSSQNVVLVKTVAILTTKKEVDASVHENNLMQSY
ncbi:hypothetical protein SADUNF_Sadunf15G0031900 [Salix dunnii]|uniref:Uncharacterized protein n=1 Tax=Salix dunnii TaxID=1413687 RepID=A0A835MIA4_9ROSI|nr:hypothetical protein SADUNF_Sadunf15G0031900 [Salix dunnii]